MSTALYLDINTMHFKNPLDIIYIISFLDLFAVGLIFPLLASHLRDLGASHTFIGALSSVYAGIQVVSGPAVGRWSDLKGRKYTLVIIAGLCSICYGLLGLTDSFLIIACIRIILGVVKHIQTICKTFITDILPKEKHTEAFGKSAAISSLGFILGPLLGGQISEFSHGFSYVCFLTAISFLINFGLAMYLPGTEVNSSLVNETKVNTCPKSIGWRKHWRAFTVRFMFAISMSTFLVNQGLLLKEKYKLSQKDCGYVISYFSTIGTCAAFFLGKTLEIYKHNDCLTSVLTFFFLLAISVIVVFLTSGLVMYLIALIPLSMSFTYLRILSMDLILQQSTGDYRGLLSGASNSVGSIARFASPLLTGVMADIFGEEYVVLVTVITAISGIIFCLHLKASGALTHSKEE